MTMKNHQLLTDKVALITGATRGIGLAIAQLFAKHGAILLINGTNERLIKENVKLLQQDGVECIAVIGDISQEQTSKTLVSQALSHFGRIDCLVNNSGIIYRRRFADFCKEEWDNTLSVNLEGLVYTCRNVIEIMAKQGSGKIVNILSSASKKPHLNASVEYGASKAGGLYLTRHLALEYARHNIYVNAVCPGPIETDLVKTWDESYRKSVLQKVPLGRLGKPEEVANVALFLASGQSDFITGEAININGGSFMD